MIDFKGNAKQKSDDDILEVAIDLGVPYAAFRAVIEIEAAGNGFDQAGRPKALFERHIFFRQLRDKPDLQAQAVEAKLAYAVWRTLPYPKGSDAVYEEITRACDIDQTAALMSTSWGLGQIMGSNYKLAGCDSVQTMVAEAAESELNQLFQMAHFIKSAGLRDELERLDWAGFARGYNGPGYAANKYDTKLAAKYEMFA